MPRLRREEIDVVTPVDSRQAIRRGTTAGFLDALGGQPRSARLRKNIYTETPTSLRAAAMNSTTPLAAVCMASV